MFTFKAKCGVEQTRLVNFTDYNSHLQTYKAFLGAPSARKENAFPTTYVATLTVFLTGCHGLIRMKNGKRKLSTDTP